MNTVSLLSIDAWRDTESGWTWNSWYARGMVPVEWCDLSVRKLLRKLREEIGLNLPAGSCAVDDDGYNLVIVLRGTREPIYAIAYGENQ